MSKVQESKVATRVRPQLNKQMIRVSAEVRQSSSTSDCYTCSFFGGCGYSARCDCCSVCTSCFTC
jgi:hypothetical protein